MANETLKTKEELYQEGYRAAHLEFKRWRYPQKYYKDSQDSYLHWIAGWDAANETLSKRKQYHF
jgi:hypothetical protein